MNGFARVRKPALTAVGLAVLVGGLVATAGHGRPTAPVGGPRALNAAETALLARAEQALVEKCLVAKGFRVWTIPVAADPADRLFPYGLDDVRWAQAHGYGLDQSGVRADDPNLRYVQSLPAARRAAYGRALNGGGPSAPGVTVTLPNGLVKGHSSTGCVAEADAHLYGDYPAWFRAESMAGYFDQARQDSVLGDPAYAAAAAAWSACMRRAGFAYATPQAARSAFLEAPTPRPRQLEIGTATAEAHCAGDTGLTATARRLDEHYADPPQAKTFRDTEQRLALAALSTAESVTDRG
jgi:hypothetical protein